MSMRQLKIAKVISNRESQSLEKYLHEISKIDLLTPEEEATLARRIKLGDQKALEKLTKANLRFVVSVAKQYQNQGLSLSDLINEGNFGLIKAAQHFDETRGFKFISYAVWYIRQSLLQALAEQSRITKLPLNKVGLSNKISKAYSDLEKEYDREPTTEELIKLLDLENNDTNIAKSSNSEIAYADIYHTELLHTEIESAFNTLTNLQRDVIKLYFGIGVSTPMSIEDISEKMSLTYDRVKLIKDKAITKLRAASRNQLLNTHIGDGGSAGYGLSPAVHIAAKAPITTTKVKKQEVQEDIIAEIINTRLVEINKISDKQQKLEAINNLIKDDLTDIVETLDNIKKIQFIFLDVYLDIRDADIIFNVYDSLLELIEIINFTKAFELLDMHGSWYKKLILKSKDLLDKDEVNSRLKEIEYSVEVNTILKPQSEVDKNQSEALLNILKAVENVPNAVIRIGSLLVVKVTPQNSTETSIQVRSLSIKELHYINKNPELLNKPGQILLELSKGIEGD